MVKTSCQSEQIHIYVHILLYIQYKGYRTHKPCAGFGLGKMVGCRLTDKSDSAELDRSSKQRINKDKLSIESNKYTDSKTDNKDKESKSAL